ncbi:MAG: FG-GAP-like repeat-containing protein [Chloroflexota bacterium]
MSRRRVSIIVVALAAAFAGAIPFAASATVSPPWDPFFAQPQVAVDMAAFGVDTRPYGIASGDFDEDGDADLVIGRTTGHLYWAAGNGNGTFAAPAQFAWKQTTNNAWSMAAGDVNGDGKLDVIWGANTASSGCTISGVGCVVTAQVADGEVRAWLGNGNGTFQENAYFVSGVRHNKGLLLADVGTDAGSVAAGDLDNDGDTDVVAGSIDGTNATVKLLRNAGAGAVTVETVVASTAGAFGSGTPIYFPITTAAAATSPFGLALGDADADGDTDLFVADRAIYVYRFDNDGTGSLVLHPGNIPQLGAARANVYLRHDPTYRAAVGFTGSLAAGDVNGDGRADVAISLHSGTQAVASNTVHDGEVILNVSNGASHELFGSLGDLGTNARGLQLIDVNGDGARDFVAGELQGKVSLLRQLPPRDADGDGISDYVDNAPNESNAPRIDMNTDGAYNAADQLDNDFDTILGNPEDESTWQRLGDPADADDDNDGVADAGDNCAFVTNGDQANVDADALGDACDPLDNRDSDGDGVPNGPNPGDPLYDAALAAAIKWSTGDTHFVIRIDALGRLFQNEFTGLMSDAAISSLDTWAAKCQGMYNAGDPDPGCATLPGGVGVPVSTVVIPRLLWTDPEVIDWINDRNDNPLFEIGQHGTYHNSGPSNTQLGDWKDDPNRNFFSCDTCGLTAAENFELLKVGYDTLVGNYDNKWLVDSGATPSSPKIDWGSSANALISYAPPFNASDEEGRKAVALLGYKAYSASVHEEGGGSLGQYFSPDENAFEQFDKFGVFHASADLEFEPPATSNGSYDPQAYAQYLAENTQDGGLNTWLIEEVEWSGRPCNDLDRLADLCNGGSNRENNTVYRPRWDGWIQLLEYVRDYPGGVAMTMAEVALAKAFDNAPTVVNLDQADSDHDGIGDVIEGVTLTVGGASLSRNQPGTLSATLANADGPLSGQTVTFEFDADGVDGSENYSAITDPNGVAEATVEATRPVGPATVDASWDGVRATAADTGSIEIVDASALTLDGTNPTSGQVTDTVTVGATLVDSDGQPLENRSVAFSIGSASASATTDAAGHASASLTLQGPAGPSSIEASFGGDAQYGSSAASAAFDVLKEDTTLALADAVAPRRGNAVATATLTEADGAALSGQTIEFFVESKVKGKTAWVSIGSAQTDATGVASVTVPARHVSRQPRPIRAVFSGDALFLGSTDDAVTYR